MVEVLKYLGPIANGRMELTVILQTRMKKHPRQQELHAPQGLLLCRFTHLTCALPRRSRADATTSQSSPRRCAILSALLRPGMPHSRRYVGASRASSNSMLTFSKRSSSYLSDVSALQCQIDIWSAEHVPDPQSEVCRLSPVS